MKTSNLKLKKLPSEMISSTNAIQAKRYSDKPLGLILASGEFIPVYGAELFTSELLTIVNVMENFPLFFDNLTE